MEGTAVHEQNRVKPREKKICILNHKETNYKGVGVYFEVSLIRLTIHMIEHTSSKLFSPSKIHTREHKNADESSDY